MLQSQTKPADHVHHQNCKACSGQGFYYHNDGQDMKKVQCTHCLEMVANDAITADHNESKTVVGGMTAHWTMIDHLFDLAFGEKYPVKATNADALHKLGREQIEQFMIDFELWQYVKIETVNLAVIGK